MELCGGDEGRRGLPAGLRVRDGPPPTHLRTTEAWTNKGNRADLTNTEAQGFRQCRFTQASFRKKETNVRGNKKNREEFSVSSLVVAAGGGSAIDETPSCENMKALLWNKPQNDENSLGHLLYGDSASVCHECCSLEANQS